MSAQSAMMEPLMGLAMSHAAGRDAYAQCIVTGLFEEFLTVEEKLEGEPGQTQQEVIDHLRVANAEDLQSVLDCVISHQGLKQKVQLVLNLMSAIVSRAPEQYRTQLRRIAALRGRGAADAVRKAQQLLEQSLQADLRSVVLSGLKGASMNLEEAMCAAEMDDAQAFVNLEIPFPTPTKRDTLAEGMFEGLEDRPGNDTIAGRIQMLVEAPAAVDDALASLMLLTDPQIQRRAMSAYIQRVHYPFMVSEPQMMDIGNHCLASVWHFTDPATAGMHNAKQCAGAGALIRSLSQIPDVLKAVAKPLSMLGNLINGGITLQLFLIGKGTDALSISPEAQKLLKSGAVKSEEVNAFPVDGFSDDPRIVKGIMDAAIMSEAETMKKLGVTTANCTAFPSTTVLSRYGYSCEEGAFKPSWALGCVGVAQAEVLELSRLQPFASTLLHEQSRNRQFHIFTVTEQAGPRSPALRRVFLRGIVRRLGRPALLAATYSSNAAATAAAAVEELEETVVDCLTDIIRRHNAPAALPADQAHIFLSVIAPLPLQGVKDRTKVAAALRTNFAAMVTRQGSSCRNAAVTTIEVRFRQQDSPLAWRVVVSAPTGHESGEEHVEVHLEECNDTAPTEEEGQGFKYVSGSASAMVKPYGPLELLQQKRLAARRHNTTYCYDFPAVFENALRMTWAERAAAGEPDAVPPLGKLVEATELVPTAETAGKGFGGEMELTHMKRSPGQNNIGMVAWLLQLKTPECPAGRQAVAIANDITYASGSFGPNEDGVFRAATEYALAEHLPVIYLAANSGARVGLSAELKDCVQVAWVNDEDPTKGYEYMYLTDEDYHRVCAATKPGMPKPVKASKIVGKQGEPIWVLQDIIGLEDGMGVECLSGSGAIASVYNRAWDEGFTVTMVSGRAVGIGAYLARLGRRVVQRVDQPIILTGYAALNKVLGRDVYSSHMQLGGPKVMGVNGVSHHVVQDDLEGAVAILRWLSYCAPELRVSRPLPTPTSDPVGRGVGYTVAQGQKIDPRAAVSGEVGADGDWRSGMFDRGSWVETQAGWARTVVTGRARLGGHPVGVIAVETQTVMMHVPADPGMPDSSERIIPQAGQVWFPDSAAKTAQAMEEFDREGLPMFILANWRGFSGGQRDLFEGVLQMGSLIVEQLRRYRQPVFVYLPPGAELRGGAWAVVDSQINKHQIEMYADPTARGGVLEPEGMVEIKFRERDMKKMMHRVDPEIQKLKGAEADISAISAREAHLMGTYRQLAVKFAELHDTPVRMAAKGVIRGVVPWHKARTFFAQRLNRCLLQESLQGHICSADTFLTPLQAGAILKSWFLNSNSRNSTPRSCSVPEAEIAVPEGLEGDELAKFQRWARDSEFSDWAEGAAGAQRIALELKALRSAAAERSISDISSTQEGKEGLLRGLTAAMQSDPTLAIQLRALLQ